MFLLLFSKFEDYNCDHWWASPHLVYGVLWIEPKTSCLIDKHQPPQLHHPYLLLSAAFNPVSHITGHVLGMPLGFVGEVLWVVRGETANPARKTGQGHFP